MSTQDTPGNEWENKMEQEDPGVPKTPWEYANRMQQLQVRMQQLQRQYLQTQAPPNNMPMYPPVPSLVPQHQHYGMWSSGNPYFQYSMFPNVPFVQHFSTPMQTSPAASVPIPTQPVTPQHSAPKAQPVNQYSGAEMSRPSGLKPQVRVLEHVPMTLVYDGQSGWYPFFKRFTRLAIEKGWGEEKKRDFLQSCLTYKASEYFSAIVKQAPTMSFLTIVEKLEKRFGYCSYPNNSESTQVDNLQYSRSTHVSSQISHTKVPQLCKSGKCEGVGVKSLLGVEDCLPTKCNRPDGIMSGPVSQFWMKPDAFDITLPPVTEQSFQSCDPCKSPDLVNPLALGGDDPDSTETFLISDSYDVTLHGMDSSCVTDARLSNLEQNAMELTKTIEELKTRIIALESSFLQYPRGIGTGRSLSVSSDSEGRLSSGETSDTGQLEAREDFGVQQQQQQQQAFHDYPP